MKISKEKKQADISYILRKIADDTDSVAVYAADSLGINKSTVHRYLKELQESGVIQKSGHGRYVLSYTERSFDFDRSAGDFESDWRAYEKYLHPFVSSFPENVVNIWKYVFSEMTNNVIDHSGADEVKVTVRQDALNTTVILEDNGIGIFEKIRSYYNYPSLEDAVSELFKGKITTDKDKHSGEGVFFSSRMMDVFCIFSGGLHFSCNELGENDLLKIRTTDYSTGTAVYMRLSNDSRKQPSEVFNTYADIDGGFTRTIIPLKNVFGSAPISRSQAKRLCERLDNFEEVKLDFTSVDWMGQGFAHQIFRVFASEHPGIRIIPVHMNDEVSKMYRHVSAS